MAFRLANGRIFEGRRRADGDGVIRGSRLALPAGVGSRYASKLIALVHQMTREVVRDLTDLFSHPDVKDYLDGFAGTVAIDISPASQSRILTNKLKSKFEQIFGEHAKDFATQMVDEALLASTADVRRSLKSIVPDLELSTAVLTTGAMKEFAVGTIAQNVALIKSIPVEYLTKVQGEVLRSITDGKGLADLVPFLQEQAGVTERRAHIIAFDQTHKAYNGFNKGRMQQAGVNQFEWIHSGGGLHPRLLHLDFLDGKIFSFDKLPIIEESTGERGIPGQAINCRCTMVPVLKLGATK